MTAQAAKKMWSRNGGSLASDDGRTFTASIEEGWQVITNAGDGIAEVLVAPDLPRLGDRFPGTSNIHVKKKDPQQVSPIFWLVNVSYDGEFGPDGASDDPLNQPPEIEWTDTETSEEIDEDFNGDPIVTANGEPIKGVQTTIADQVLSVNRNFRSLDTFAVRAYRRSTNSDSFAGWPAGTARLSAYSAKLAYQESGSTYWKVSAKITFREPYNTTDAKAWYARVLHEGFYVKVGTDIVRAVDDNKEPTSKPVMLKSDGTRKESGDSPHWLEFQKYGSLPYSSLGLI